MPEFHFPIAVRITDAGIAQIVLPVFLIIAAGFVFGKIKRVEISAINDLVLYVAAPCLILSSFASPPMDAAFVARIFVFFVCVSAICLAFGIFLTRILNLPRPVYVPTIIFGNCGNMGLPLILFAFGMEGFQIAVVCMAAVAFIHYTLGVALVSPRGAVYEIFKLPLIYSAVGGMFLNFGGHAMPLFLERAVSLLGEMAVPGMMFVLGYRLSQLSISGFRESFLFGCCRIGLGFFAALAIVRLFQVPPLAEKVMVLQCAMPTAVTCLVLAEKYNAEPEKVASVIAVGTAVSFLVLPSMILYLTV